MLPDQTKTERDIHLHVSQQVNQLLVIHVSLLLKIVQLLLETTETRQIWNQCHLVFDALEVVQNSIYLRLGHANFSNRQPVSD